MAPLLRTVYLAGRSFGLHEAAPAVPGAATWVAAAVSGWEGYQRKSGFYRFSFVKIWLTLAFNNVQLVHHIAVKYGLATLIRKSAAFSEQILLWKFYEIVSWPKLVNWCERRALLWLGAWVLFLGIAWVHMAAFFLLGLRFLAALHYFSFWHWRKTLEYHSYLLSSRFLDYDSTHRWASLKTRLDLLSLESKIVGNICFLAKSPSTRPLTV